MTAKVFRFPATGSTTKSKPTAGKAKRIDEALLAHALTLVDGIKKGRIRGLVTIASTGKDGERDATAAHGTYARDIHYAIYSSIKQLSALADTAVVQMDAPSGESVHAELEQPRKARAPQLPAMLRRKWPS